jgi:dolichyl-phosphate-mannose--protein O-mannosyl transferase
VFFGVAALIFYLNVAAIAILQINPIEIRVIIASWVLTLLVGLFVSIGTKIPTTLPFRRDTFRIGTALTVGFSVGGMLWMLLAHLVHYAPRPLEILQMIAFRKLFIYYVAIFALLWLLQKCSYVSVILVQNRQTEESYTTDEESANGVEYLLLL